jgi:uroporphyrinogen-III synthase
MTPILTIRPQPGARHSVAAGRARGLEITAFPLSVVQQLDWIGPDLAEVDALLVGSANAFRHGGTQLARYRDKPAYVVGPATAREAASLGFRVQLAGEGGLQALLDKVQQRPVRLLRLAGQRHVEITAPEGVALTTIEIYAVHDLPIPDAMAEILRSGATVLLHSAGAAEHFRNQCLAQGLDLARIRLAALGPRIADAAGAGWGRVGWCDAPESGALLDLAADMCQ